MENKQRKSVREEFADKFISILESDNPLEWIKGWASNGVTTPYNGQSGHQYSGINRLVLMFKSMDCGYTDPRFYTFYQVSNMDNCKVKFGEKATAVEFWSVFDTVEKQSISFSEYERLLRDDPTRKEDEFRIYAKTAYVFNAAQIDGVQPLPQQERNEIVENRLAEESIKTMFDNIGVKLNYGGDEAYYSPVTDTIQLPPRESFYSAGEYYGTALHELAHSTAAPSRLDRSLVAYRKDRDQYAIEELRAEIASTFVSSELSVDMPEAVIKNHMAYVSSWLSQIKKDHNVLFSAIKDADRIADYLIDQGRVDVLREKITIEEQMPKDLSDSNYEIWQLKHIPENESIEFSDFDFASKFRLTESRYDKIYEGSVDEETDTLGKIYFKFNVDRPTDFRGHSLSMSDVVVLNRNGERSAWYCDTYGFQEIKGFCKIQNQMKRGKVR